MALSRKKTESSEKRGGCHCNGGRTKTSSGSFDLDAIRHLTALMNEYGLAEVEMAQGDDYIHVRRGGVESTVPVVPPPTATPAPVVTASEEAPTAPAKTINSPMVGTFYRSASPGGKPLVSEGDTVGTETIVCIIEAMKVFNQIPAEASGRITRVLVEDGGAVEYGQPLFAVE
ncbi:MAG: acetyl-CoA carboxylase biotin carboxyl carrier protein [Planctomycetia bacterium]|nr:acetyl-CoA carboxylase biotin carboxyl carrier protein [Planctomycetia bacterium]